MAVTVPQKYLFDVETYHQMGESQILPPSKQFELIEGEIIAMPPIGSMHAYVVTELSEELYDTLGKLAKIRIQNPIRLGDLSEPQPDIAIVRRVEHRYISAHPTAEDILLLIEVADTSTSYDRDTKMLLYARYGIPEVWLVYISKRWVEVFRKPTPHGYKQITRVNPEVQMTPVHFPDVTLTFHHILGIVHDE